MIGNLGSVACPYCYERINRFRLGYLCTGRGVPGRRGCQKAIDPVRVEQASVAEASRHYFTYQGRRPVHPDAAGCPECGGESGIRACPDCHSPLPSGFAGAASPLVALVGARNTGKSVYLAVLTHELQSTVRKRFDAAVRLAGDRQGGETSPGNWVNTYVDGLYQRHRLPPQTSQIRGRHRDPLVIEWRQERRSAGRSRLRTSFLSFYDTAGEDFRSLDQVYELDYLASADALIVMLDPFTIGSARDRIDLPPQAVRTQDSPIDVLSRVTGSLKASHKIKNSKRIDLPLAVAITKIDAFFDVLGPDHPVVRAPVAGNVYDDCAGADLHEHLRALVHDWDADGPDSYLGAQYNNFRYFAVSSLGAQPDYSRDEVDPGGIRPHQVEEPLVWLLAELGVVPRTGRP